MKYVASMLATSMNYVLFGAAANDMPQRRMNIHVEGGTGVANRNTITPHGVVTAISDEQAEALEHIELFRIHRKNGFVQILDENPGAPERVAGDMNPGDPGAPLTPSDYTNTDTGAPLTPSDYTNTDTGGAAPALPVPKVGKQQR